MNSNAVQLSNKMQAAENARAQKILLKEQKKAEKAQALLLAKKQKK
jgi:hypothetical protein